jgi:uncharacterized transporter YbjL
MLLVGGFIGYKEIAHKKLLERLDKFQLAALILLLFIMGIRIGADQEVMGAISTIGFKALVFSVISIGVSVLFVWIYEKAFNKGGRRG